MYKLHTIGFVGYVAWVAYTFLLRVCVRARARAPYIRKKERTLIFYL